MFEHSFQSRGDYPFIGHPIPFSITRHAWRAFSEPDALVPTLAARESQRSSDDHRQQCGPGPGRELLALLAESTITESEWLVLSESVRQWGGSALRRSGRGVEVLAAHPLTPQSCIATGEAMARLGRFLIVNCAETSMRVAVADRDNAQDIVLRSSVHTPQEVAERWSSENSVAQWIVVFLPQHPEPIEFVHHDWARIRNSLVQELLARGATPSLRIALLPSHSV